MRKLTVFLVISLIFIVLYSCNKRELLATIDEVIMSQQETQSDEVLTDVDLMVDEALISNGSTLKAGTLTNANYLSSCAIVTIDAKSNPQMITIDFGTSCTGKDGKVRSGKIIVTSESFNTFPSVRKKTFENYTVDVKKITGTMTKTIQRDNVNNVRTANLQEDIIITLPGTEGTAHRVANLTRQYHLNTLGNPDDNQLESWGTVEFTRASGVKVTKTIEQANMLVFSASCHHIVSGIVSFTTSNNHSWSINFGNGECDNKAILTIGTKTKEITIR